MMRGRGQGPRTRGRCMIGFLMALAALPAAAQVGPLTNQNLFFDQAANVRRGNYLEADAGLVYTDNVGRISNGSGDTLALLGLLGNLAREGPRFDFRLASDIAVVKYIRSDFQTQPFGYLDGSGQLWIVPGFFSWTGRETYSQTVLDPFAPVTPDNLEGLNYATTGPRITIRPTLRTTLTVDGTYSYLTSSSKSPLYVDLDNHRYGGDATLSHAFSNSSSAYITGSAYKVDFIDQIDNSNFTEDQGQIGYKLGSARTVLDIGGGYSKLSEIVPTTVQTLRGPRQVPEKQTPTGAIWHIELSRQISSSSRLALHALQQVTDAANLFRLNLDQPVASTAADRLTSGQPFTNREFGGDYRIQASRTSIELAFLAISERYKVNPTSNRDVKDATALLGRQLSPVLSWDIGAEWEHQSFALNGSSNTLNAITDVRWQISRQVGLRFLYGHSALSPHGYTENQVGVIASYAFVPGGQEASQQGEQPAAPLLNPGVLPGSAPLPRPQ
jgi:hypothetical protein